jgi:hypothetical protein
VRRLQPERGKQIAKLGAHVLRIGNGLRNLFAKELAESLPQPVNGDLERSFGRVELPCQRSISGPVAFGQEQAFEALELRGFPVSNRFVTQLVLDTSQQGECPLAFEDSVGRQVTARLEAVSPFGMEHIVECQRQTTTASLQRACRITLVGDEVFERREQKRAEASA